MKQPTGVFFSLILMLSSGVALAAANNNGQANAAADAGLPAPDAHENLPPKNLDNSQINSGSVNTNQTGNTSGDGATLSGDGMTSDEVHKNTMCKDGRCPDTNKKVETQNGTTPVQRKTDGTTY
ncbi:YbgS-like family protein [Enterobacteriaceae bacterium YMB-R22]|jgi:hypothetical protein|uniref:YbgS-like family protein n=1 Tax=Tenebrionicola larvae TaxID=2815733 RepID=UPI0020121A49|nr:YbgS-like family protein [Tenebrionicola larvae]MBV4412331.1 YbgS-like family protein [Tenebrionicola larvae]